MGRVNHGKKANRGASDLGKALIKRAAIDRRNKLQHDATKTGFQTADIEATQLQSVLQVDSLEEFMAQAVMEDRKFEAVRSNLVMIDAQGKVVDKADRDTKSIDTIPLRIPRKPEWNADMTKDELHALEKQAFSAWRATLAGLEETTEGVKVTPYEKTLGIWRQLWQVVERSDVLVQIVDARNPLLFLCPDLYDYVKAVNPAKEVLLLLNKSDFLAEEHREMWAKYFMSQGLPFVFFSAKAEQRKLDAQGPQQVALEEHFADQPEIEQPDYSDDESETSGPRAPIADPLADIPEEPVVKSRSPKPELTPLQEACRLLDRLELIELLETRYQHLRHVDTAPAAAAVLKSRLAAAQAQKAATLAPEKAEGIAPQEKRVTIGMVGYPNVGKSSTINVLLGVTATDHSSKRVAISATPGKTKNFQTLVLTDSVMLCDCPGLVFPMFVGSTADLVLNGIFPIDQLRDYMGPINLMCQRITRSSFEKVYGMEVPLPHRHSQVSDAVVPTILLDAFCKQRGYMASGHSGADQPRGSRYLLKDYVAGRLLYLHAPPGMPFDHPDQTLGGAATAMDEHVVTDGHAESKGVEADYSGSALSGNVLLDPFAGGAADPALLAALRQESARGGASGYADDDTGRGPRGPSNHKRQKAQRRLRKGERRDDDPYGTAASAETVGGVSVSNLAGYSGRKGLRLLGPVATTVGVSSAYTNTAK